MSKWNSQSVARRLDVSFANYKPSFSDGGDLRTSVVLKNKKDDSLPSFTITPNFQKKKGLETESASITCSDLNDQTEPILEAIKTVVRSCGYTVVSDAPEVETEDPNSQVPENSGGKVGEVQKEEQDVSSQESSEEEKTEKEILDTLPEKEVEEVKPRETPETD